MYYLLRSGGSDGHHRGVQQPPDPSRRPRSARADRPERTDPDRGQQRPRALRSVPLRAARTEGTPRPEPRLPLAAAAGRTLVVAHRGSSGSVAEHTLAAYEQAITEGADALECDVRLTRDGHLVCVHDRRVNRTSDGRGTVSALELADLADLDFASWKNRDPALQAGWDEADHTRSGVLTLETLLALATDAPRPVQLHIETKHPTRYAGKVEQTLAELLGRFGLAEPPRAQDSMVTVMSFASSSLRRIRVLTPAVPTVLLLDRLPLLLRDGLLPSYADVAGPGLEVLRDHPRFVERVHRGGARVHCWTVDDPQDVAYVLGLGVDAVITNRPAEVVRRLGRGEEAAGPP